MHFATNPHQAMVRILEANGLSERDVTLVNLTLVDQISALNAGLVDAILGSTTVLEPRDKGYFRIVGSSANLPPVSGNLTGVMVRDDFAQAYPDATRRVVRALVKAAAWASHEENRKDLITLFARNGIAAKYYEEDLAGPLAPRFSPLFDGAALKGYAATVRFTQERRFIRRDPDISGWIDPRFLNAALKDLKLEGFWKPIS